MTTKQKTTGAAAAVVATVGIISSIFMGNRYDTEKNAVQTDLADDYVTVLIFKGTDPNTGDIVYADQADSTFEAVEEFTLMDGVDSGKYTMMLGGKSDGSKPLKKTFYIGKSKLGLSEPVYIGLDE